MNGMAQLFQPMLENLLANALADPQIKEAVQRVMKLAGTIEARLVSIESRVAAIEFYTAPCKEPAPALEHINGSAGNE